MKRALQLQRKAVRSRNKGKAVEGYRIRSGHEHSEQSSPTLGSSWSRLRSALPSVHTATGLLLAPALAVHVALNRIVPSHSSSPINELSPSELDYTYVTYGFEAQAGPAWRAVTWTMYALLLGAGALHVVAGTDRIAQRMRMRRRRGIERATDKPIVGLEDGETGRAAMRQLDSRRRKQRQATATALVSLSGMAWLAWGLSKMVSEGSGVSGFMARRVCSG